MPRPLTPAETREKLVERLRTTTNYDTSTAKREAELSVRRVFDSKDKKGN